MHNTAEVHDASPEMIDAALRGPHSGWRSLSIEMEGARFHELHSLIGNPAFTEDDEIRTHEILDELELLARSVGYADSDSLAGLAGGRSDEELETDMTYLHLRHMLLNPHLSEYFALVAGSETLLSGAAATWRAKAVLQDPDQEQGLHGPIHSRMLAGYQDGRHAAELHAGCPTP